MQFIRAFIAGELSPETQQSLKPILTELYKKSDRQFHWISLENIHLTLKFIGNIELCKLDQLITALKPVIATYPTINYQLEKFGAFPNFDNPRIFWLGIKAPLELTKLVDVIEENAARAGIRRENRSFSPHLTLCRIKQNLDKNSIKGFLNSLSPDLLNFSCHDHLDQLTIFKSTLTSQGSIYSPITQLSLQKNPPSV